MKKKIMLGVLFVLFFVMTGCRVKNVLDNNDVNNNNVIENAKDKLIINGYNLTLTEESSFSKISFKYPNGGIISNPLTSLVIDYPKKGSDESYFRIAMGDMYGTNIDDSMKGFTKEGKKTINGIEWTLYKDTNGRNNYGVNIDYSNIVIGFIYEDPDLSKFEEEFMNNVTLNK